MVILMKKITNKYFVRFCEVIKRSLVDSANYENCLSDMISASADDTNHKCVYNETKYNMEVIKLDEYTKDFDKKCHLKNPRLKVSHQPYAVDAVCVNKDNEWFLIEFKNQKLKEVIKEVPKKMLSSLWLIAFLYSELSEKIADETDILKFARENVTFITVVSSDKNEDDMEAIGTIWEKNASFYTPKQFEKYKGYYFKDIYVLSEQCLKFFVDYFE